MLKTVPSVIALLFATTPVLAAGHQDVSRLAPMCFERTSQEMVAAIEEPNFLEEIKSPAIHEKELDLLVEEYLYFRYLRHLNSARATDELRDHLSNHECDPDIAYDFESPKYLKYNPDSENELLPSTSTNSPDDSAFGSNLLDEDHLLISGSFPAESFAIDDNTSNDLDSESTNSQSRWQFSGLSRECRTVQSVANSICNGTFDIGAFEREYNRRETVDPTISAGVASAVPAVLRVLGVFAAVVTVSEYFDETDKKTVIEQKKTRLAGINDQIFQREVERLEVLSQIERLDAELLAFYDESDEIAPDVTTMLRQKEYEEQRLKRVEDRLRHLESTKISIEAELGVVEPDVAAEERRDLTDNTPSWHFSTVVWPNFIGELILEQYSCGGRPQSERQPVGIEMAPESIGFGPLSCDIVGLSRTLNSRIPKGMRRHEIQADFDTKFQVRLNELYRIVGIIEPSDLPSERIVFDRAARTVGFQDGLGEICALTEMSVCHDHDNAMKAMGYDVPIMNGAVPKMDDTPNIQR